MSFTTIKLAANQVLVRGTDVTGKSGETILDGSEWDAVNGHTDQHQAVAEFEAAIEEFFAPIAEAAAALEAAQSKVNTDPLYYIVVDEGQDATPGRPTEVIQLSRDSVILRLIEENADTDRLIWVKDRLVVTAAPVESTKPSFFPDEPVSTDENVGGTAWEAPTGTPIGDSISAEGSEPSA